MRVQPLAAVVWCALVWIGRAPAADSLPPRPAVIPRPRTVQSPTVEHVAPVAPGILAIEIQAGHVLPSHYAPYVPQPGDTANENRLVRGGQEIGWLIGARRDGLVTFERLEGDPLQEELAGWPGTYTIASTGDPHYRTAVHPLAVYRKSKPNDWEQPGRRFAMRHIVYLKLPAPLVPGARYTIGFGELNVRTSSYIYTHRPERLRSEAVHVNQVGFRPDDAVKRAFLSVWLGTGGACSFARGLRFSLLDDATGGPVYRGTVELAKAASEPEAMWGEPHNWNLTDVSRMDFSDFRQPGRYRVYVEGIGCSYPFEIGRDVWQRAFAVQMKGFYNQRSGIALGPPYTTFRKPRDFHPADGAPVTASTYSFLDGGDLWKGLAQGDTGRPVPQAWGGYHDAGDWNPRSTAHLSATMYQLELLEMFPAYFEKLRLNIPTLWPVPPLLNEALWQLDLFRRLQAPEGGVGQGIETNGDPIEGEVSWKQSMPAYVFAPDLWSSYQYTAVAARAAKLLRQYDMTLADRYQESALRAMRWAEADYARRIAAGTAKQLPWECRDDRNYAALMCYDLTREARWHDVFLENTCLTEANANVWVWGDHVQRDAAFAYARLPEGVGDPALKRTAVRALTQHADAMLAYAAGNAFNVTAPDVWRPVLMGFYSVPEAVQLVRAHYLTGDRKYLAGAVQACQFASGANANNMTYTTGVGANPPQHPLHLDSRRTGQPAPEGLTVYGNLDFHRSEDAGTDWVMKWYLDKASTPSAYEWPVPEAYFDIFLYPAINEYTMPQTLGPNAYVWGYLAARK